MHLVASRRVGVRCPVRPSDRRVLAPPRRGAIFIDPQAEEASLWHLVALSVREDASGVAPGSAPLTSRGAALRADASAFVERHLSQVVEEHRTARCAELPERHCRVNIRFDLQSAALAKRVRHWPAPRRTRPSGRSPRSWASRPRWPVPVNAPFKSCPAPRTGSWSTPFRFCGACLTTLRFLPA